MKKFITLLLCGIVSLSLVSCGSSTTQPSETPSAPPVVEQEGESTPEETPDAAATEGAQDSNDTPTDKSTEKPEGDTQNGEEETLPEKSDKLAYGDVDTPQLAPMENGEKIAKITTNMGTITFRLFPKDAPQGVDNFITLAEEGYYNGNIFHRIAKDFVIQTGDPTGTGYGGESKWGTPFKNEVSPKLHHLRGAVAYANSGADTNGSQFYFVQAGSLPDHLTAEIKDMDENWNDVVFQDAAGNLVTKGDMFPEKIRESYLKDGGLPELDFKYTIFGQVIEGMDVVDKIANVEYEPNAERPQEGKPKKDVIIEKVEILTYNK